MNIQRSVIGVAAGFSDCIDHDRATRRICGETSSLNLDFFHLFGVDVLHGNTVGAGVGDVGAIRQ